MLAPKHGNQYMYKDTPGSVLSNSKRLEKMYESINRVMDKKIIVHSYNKIASVIKKKEADLCDTGVL